MHNLDIGIYPDHRAGIAGRFLAVGGVNVVLATTSKYMHRHLLEDNDTSCGCDSGTPNGVAVGRRLDVLVGTTGLRGVDDSA